MGPARPTAEIKTNSDGTVTVHYVPNQSGPHDINVTYNEQPVNGTPIRINVDSTNGHFVSAYGPGLVQGKSAEHLEFYVTGKTSDVDIKIQGPGKADIIKKEDKGGILHVEYVPMSPGEYDIHIKHKGKAIHGSPFSAKISGDSQKRSQLSFPASSEYLLGGKDIDMANMVGVLKNPKGVTEPCLLKKTSEGKLSIAAFQPKMKGQYVVEVTQDGKNIQGSPFKIDISDSHVCNANHVKVSGANKEAIANKWNDVTINIADAGHGSLGISVEGAHRSDLELKGNSPKEYVLQYKPHEPGVYLLNIKFGDDHVAGSPFMVKVGGEPSGRIRETVVRQIPTPEVVFPGTQCHLQLKVPGTDALSMESTVTSPSGKTEFCDLKGLPDSLCDIKFTPTEDGVHTISLKHKGLHYSGSPFQYTVGKPASGGTHKVEFGGPGAEHGEVGAKNEFNIYTREAGAGQLTISIEGPSKAVMEVMERGNGHTSVGYTVAKEGDYGIHVKYNDEHVPDSPCTVHVAPASGDAKKIQIIGLRDRGVDLDKPVTFCLEMNSARGQLKAHVNTPSGTQEDVFITELDEDNSSLRFLPRENGVYYVHIKFNEAHIPYSPLPILVGKMGADPALVFAKGDGLEKGETGKAAKFTVVTTNSGTGTLTVNIEGPSKVALVCTEMADGYEFSYTPMAPGNFMIMVKYSNVTIAGAPFKAVVTGAGKPSSILESSGLFVDTVEKKPGASKVKRFHGDASRVIAQGNGLKKGFIGRPATFTLDVKDAGQALLTIGLISPSGNPGTEVSYKKAKPTMYNVSYSAPEKGDHTLVIRWGADEIPGSPFTIPVQ